jgi:phospholipase/carboxylesterase
MTGRLRPVSFRVNDFQRSPVDARALAADMVSGRRRRLMKRLLPFLVLIAFVTITSLWLWARSAPLAVIARGGAGPPSMVLLHGYGSRAEDWLQFEQKWRLPPGTRRVYPQAPLRGPLTGQRGWWWLGLESYVPAGERLPDMSQASPGGIKVASRLVRELLRHEPQPVILGGFSQGAMTSAEIAFQTDQDLGGLILLAGTTVNEAAWAEQFPSRSNLPIFIAHGRADGVLPFAIMERFQARLKASGMNVTWYPFDGGHGIPDEVLREISAWVGTLPGPPSVAQSGAGRD